MRNTRKRLRHITTDTSVIRPARNGMVGRGGVSVTDIWLPIHCVSSARRWVNLSQRRKSIISCRYLRVEPTTKETLCPYARAVIPRLLPVRAVGGNAGGKVGGEKISIASVTGSGHGVSREKSRFQVGYIARSFKREEVAVHG